LSVYTQSDFPADWAMTQNNLANAYRERIEGDPIANLELAIQAYQAALEVRTPRKYPIESGRIQASLEATIELRDTHAQRDLHHPEIYDVETQISSISDSQLAQIQLVQALLECPQGEEDRLLAAHPELVDKGLVMALLAMAQMLRDRNDPALASTIQWLVNFAEQLALKLGLNIYASSEINDEEYDNFFQELLQTVNDSNGNGRIVYQFFDEHLSYLDEKLLAILPRQVRILFARKDESEWKFFVASTLNSLAENLCQFPRGNQLINLELAIECFRLALEVYGPNDYPEQWALTQMNLANAYGDRIGGDRSANLEQSIECFRLALEVYTRTEYPLMWARTQMNLAITYQDRIQGERAANLEQSIECFGLALKVYTRADYPEHRWAVAQLNLANAYQHRIRGERAANLEQSIECYRYIAALTIPQCGQ
jgi:tetratricopeptide (TPR) repeat protein